MRRRCRSRRDAACVVEARSCRLARRASCPSPPSRARRARRRRAARYSQARRSAAAPSTAHRSRDRAVRRNRPCSSAAARRHRRLRARSHSSRATKRMPCAQSIGCDEVVRRLVITVREEIGPAAALPGPFCPGHRNTDGHALLDEAIMVGAHEEALTRVGIGRQRHAERPHGCATIGPSVERSAPKSNHVFEGIGQDRHVEIDVGDDVRDRHGRMLGEIVRADQPLLPRR